MLRQGIARILVLAALFAAPYGFARTGGGHGHSGGSHHGWGSYSHTASHTSFHTTSYTVVHTTNPSNSHATSHTIVQTTSSTRSHATSHPASHTTLSNGPRIAASGVERDSRGKIKRDPAQRRAFESKHPCPSTGKTSGGCPGYVVDHVVPLKRGGKDAPSNMQWQTEQASRDKDRWE